MAVSAHPLLGTNSFAAQIRVILLGESGTGKTSISNRVATGDYRELVPSTIGVAYRRFKFTTLSGTTADLAMWDTAGQEKFRSLIPKYFRDADAALFVFDISNARTFEELQFWLESIPKMHPSAARCSVIVGNKADLESQRAVTEQQAAELAARYNLSYAEASAKSGVGLNLALDLLVSRYITDWNNSRPASARASQARIPVVDPAA